MLYLSAYLSIHPSTCLDAYYIVFSTESYNIPIGSMYGIFTYICHKNQQKKGGKYTNCPWIPMGSGMSTSQKNRPIYRSHWQLGIPANSFWWHPLAPHPDHFCYPDLWERGSRSSTPYLSWVTAGKTLKRTCNLIPNLSFFGGVAVLGFFMVEILPVTVTKQVMPSKFLNFRIFNVA